MSLSFIEIIKSKVTMKEILDMCNLKPANRKLDYHCPFHGIDKCPSATISRGVFHCFTCSVTYDQIDFVVNYCKIPKNKAMRMINDNFKLGLYNNCLTYQQKRELKKEQYLRDKEKKKKDNLNRYKQLVLNKIIEKLRFYEKIEKENHPTKKQIRENCWYENRRHKFFTSLRQQKWLNWLYDYLCGFEHEYCEYDFIYNDLKYDDLLREIYKGNIII